MSNWDFKLSNGNPLFCHLFFLLLFWVNVKFIHHKNLFNNKCFKSLEDLSPSSLVNTYEIFEKRRCIKRLHMWAELYLHLVYSYCLFWWWAIEVLNFAMATLHLSPSSLVNTYEMFERDTERLHMWTELYIYSSSSLLVFVLIMNNWDF